MTTFTVTPRAPNAVEIEMFNQVHELLGGQPMDMVMTILTTMMANGLCTVSKDRADFEGGVALIVNVLRKEWSLQHPETKQ